MLIMVGLEVVDSTEDILEDTASVEGLVTLAEAGVMASAEDGVMDGVEDIQVCMAVMHQEFMVHHQVLILMVVCPLDCQDSVIITITTDTTSFRV